MVKIPPNVLDLLRRPDSNKTMSTVSENGLSHSVVCGSLMVPDDETIGVGRVWLRTTGKNLSRDPRAEFLVWSGKNAFSIECTLKGSIGDVDAIQSLRDKLGNMNMDVNRVWLFSVDAIYDQGISDTTGQKIA